MGGVGVPKSRLKQFGFRVKRELFTYKKELDRCGTFYSICDGAVARTPVGLHANRLRRKALDDLQGRRGCLTICRPPPSKWPRDSPLVRRCAILLPLIAASLPLAQLDQFVGLLLNDLPVDRPSQRRLKVGPDHYFSAIVRCIHRPR